MFPIFSLLSLISSPQILSYACSTYSNTTHLCRSSVIFYVPVFPIVIRRICNSSLSSVSLFDGDLHPLALPQTQPFRWVFFDDEKTSETYAEQLTHCRGCGRALERKGLRATTPSLLP